MDPVHGTACVKCGPRDLGAIPYQVEVSAGGHPSVVKFARRLSTRDGEQLHLTLEDGRMMDCQVIDASPYCAVIGEGIYFDRRSAER
jgi:hypothetical protein